MSGAELKKRLEHWPFPGAHVNVQVHLKARPSLGFIVWGGAGVQVAIRPCQNANGRNCCWRWWWKENRGDHREINREEFLLFGERVFTGGECNDSGHAPRPPRAAIPIEIDSRRANK